MRCRCCFKIPSKVKRTNIFQHIQVHKSQGNQMSESSRKLWQAYIHFPYDFMTLHVREAANFQYQFICTSTLSSPKITLDTVLLWSKKKKKSLCTPRSFGDNGWSGSGMPGTPVPHCRDLQRGGVMSCVSWGHQRFFPRPRSCLRELGHVQNSCSRRMTQRSRGRPRVR